MASSVIDALTVVRDAVAPAVSGAVTIYRPSKPTVAGEWAWVEPDSLDQADNNRIQAQAGIFVVRVAVRIPTIDLQDKAERISDLLDPTQTESVQHHIWASCPDARIVGVTWGNDADTAEYGADLRAQLLLTRAV